MPELVQLSEVRCSREGCGKLLATASMQEGIVEIKCKCGHINRMQAIRKISNDQTLNLGIFQIQHIST